MAEVRLSYLTYLCLHSALLLVQAMVSSHVDSDPYIVWDPQLPPMIHAAWTDELEACKAESGSESDTDGTITPVWDEISGDWFTLADYVETFGSRSGCDNVDSTDVDVTVKGTDVDVDDNKAANAGDETCDVSVKVKSEDVDDKATNAGDETGYVSVKGEDDDVDHKAVNAEHVKCIGIGTGVGVKREIELELKSVNTKAEAFENCVDMLTERPRLAGTALQASLRECAFDCVPNGKRIKRYPTVLRRLRQLEAKTNVATIDDTGSTFWNVELGPREPSFPPSSLRVERCFHQDVFEARLQQQQLDFEARMRLCRSGLGILGGA